MTNWLEILPKISKWFFDRKLRLTLLGYRPEVICIVIDAETRKKILLTQPTASETILVPPQEGIAQGETVEHAATRCLQMELGLDENTIHFRKSTWVGTLRLSKDRLDERDLEGSLRQYAGMGSMIGKAYYAALIFVPFKAKSKINKAEIKSKKWVSLNKVSRYFHLVSQEKEEILLSSMKRLGF